MQPAKTQKKTRTNTSGLKSDGQNKQLNTQKHKLTHNQGFQWGKHWRQQEQAEKWCCGGGGRNHGGWRGGGGRQETRHLLHRPKKTLQRSSQKAVDDETWKKANLNEFAG